MNTEMIAKTETFLKDTFAASTYLQSNPADRGLSFGAFLPSGEYRKGDCGSRGL